MDSLDGQQARDHIEMVERIIVESSQRLCYGAEYFVVWGVYSASVTVSWQLMRNGVLPMSAIYGQIVLLAAAVAFSIYRGRVRRAGQSRLSLVQREFFNVLWLTLGLGVVANVGAFNLFSGWASAGIWSFAEAIVLFFIGMHGNRRAQIGGLLVVVSLVAANFVAGSITGYVLAAGMLAGYTGFGLAELFASD